MKNRLAVLANALAATTVLAALVIGVPWLLVTFVGSPLPTTVPTAADVVAAVRHQGVDPSVVVKILAVIVWVAWAQIAWATIVEIRAAAVGRLAARQPLLPGVQLGVARLVAAVAIAAASLTAPKLPSAGAAQPAALAAVVAGPATTHLATSNATSLAAATILEAGPLPTWTVVRHDTYWDIAERTLGDGHGWRRIRDLNVGRTMPDGTVIAAASDLLRPGWILNLPADAQAPTAHTDRPGETADPAIAVVEAGEHLWSLAEHELAERLGREPTTVEVTHYWSQLLGLNHQTIDDPDVVRPGQVVALPEVPHEGRPLGPRDSASNAELPAAAGTDDQTPVGPAAVAPAPSTTATPSTAPPVTATPPSTNVVPSTAALDPASDDEASDDEERPTVPGVLGVAGGTLAAGVTLAYRRRRTRVASAMPRGCDLPAPAGFDDLRAELSAAADLDDVARRDAALTDIARSGATLVEARTRSGAITVKVRRGDLHPPLGWTADTAGTTWTLDASSAPLAAGGACPAPLLVTVGRADDTDVHIDLETLGVAAVVGNGSEVAEFVRAVTAEIAHAPSSRRAHLVTVGATGDLVAGDAPHRAFTWDEVADDLLALARQTTAAVEARGAATVFAARADGHPDDALVPTLVVVPDVPDDPRFADLAAIVAEGRAAVAVLVAGPAAPATVITLEDGIVDVPSLGVHAIAQVLAPATVDAIVDLLAAADEVPVDTPPLDFGDDIDVTEAAVTDVVVRVLGRVRVDGAFRNLTPKQTAVVTFIALHSPVGAERIEDAVWPDSTASRRKRLANTLSECRNALGANALPVAEGGLYRVGPGVTTDTALFDTHVRAARHHHPDSPEARALLRRALELVDGPVFDIRSADRGSYVWVDVENLMVTWDLKIADVALALNDAATEARDFDEAIWAAETGLRTSPTHVELTEALMTAYAARGDRAAAEAVYTSHVAALHGNDFDDVAESTQQLRDRLRTRETA